MAPETTRRASRQRLWPFLHPFALRRRWLPSVCQAVPDIEPRRYLPFVGRRENALVGGTHAVLLLQPERRLAPRVRPPVRARVVIRVNQIMKWARMVRMTRIHSLDEPCSFLVLLEPVGTFWNRTENRQSIKQSGFVVRMLGVGSRHCVAVVLVARRFASSAGILIESGQRREIRVFRDRKLPALTTLSVRPARDSEGSLSDPGQALSRYLAKDFAPPISLRTLRFT
jgi:hypothetical protein